MTLFELVLIVLSGPELALLPLLALALLPTLTGSLGAVGGGLAATALGAGLGAGQGAIISAATGQDPGKGALIGAGTGALGAGAGSIAGAGAQGGAAVAEGVEAGTAATTVAGASGDIVTTGAPIAGQGALAEGGAILGQGADQLAAGGQTGFQLAQAAQGGVPDALSSTGSFAEAPVSSALSGPVSGETLREAATTTVAGAADKGDLGLKLAKALTTFGTLGGQKAATVPPGPPDILRRIQPRARPKIHGREAPIDPVIALFAAIRQKQANRNLDRKFF